MTSHFQPTVARFRGVARLESAGAAAILLTVCAFGQTQEPRVAFEVASVKRAGPPQIGTGMRSLRDGIDYPNVTLRMCISNAYHVQDYQISAPSWMADERYDIVAKMPKSGDIRKISEMIQTLLADRFQLKLHVEKKDFPGYALVVSPDGPKFAKEGTDDDSKILAQLGGIPPQPLLLHKHLLTGGQQITGVHASMEYLARSLSMDMGYPVEDTTGLGGGYNFVIEMSREDMRNGMNARGPGREGEDPGVSIFSSIQSIGLKLRPEKKTLDLIVVDHAEKVPTPN
jgi:uncharacterized protein (TIGR03435 family)